MTLKIFVLLERFESAESALRHHPTIPPVRNNDDEVAFLAWKESYQRTYDDLVKCRDEIESQVKAWMSALSDSEASVDMLRRKRERRHQLCELTCFNSWMALRQDKRWGDRTNAKDLATESIKR